MSFTAETGSFGEYNAKITLRYGKNIAFDKLPGGLSIGSSQWDYEVETESGVEERNTPIDVEAHRNRTTVFFEDEDAMKTVRSYLKG